MSSTLSAIEFPPISTLPIVFSQNPKRLVLNHILCSLSLDSPLFLLPPFSILSSIYNQIHRQPDSKSITLMLHPDCICLICHLFFSFPLCYHLPLSLLFLLLQRCIISPLLRFIISTSYDLLNSLYFTLLPSCSIIVTKPLDPLFTYSLFPFIFGLLFLHFFIFKVDGRRQNSFFKMVQSLKSVCVELLGWVLFQCNKRSGTL